MARIAYKAECIASLTNLLGAVLNDEITDDVIENFYEGTKELVPYKGAEFNKTEAFLGDLFLVTNITKQDNALIALTLVNGR